MRADRRPAGGTGSREAIAFTAVLLAMTVALLASTISLSASAALVPRAVGLPLAALLGYVLIRDIQALRRRREAGAADAATRNGDEVGAVLWLLALPALATVLGFLAGPTLYVMAWARFRARERWVAAIAAGALTVALIHLLFGALLGVRLPHGFLYSVLGRGLTGPGQQPFVD